MLARGSTQARIAADHAGVMAAGVPTLAAVGSRISPPSRVVASRSSPSNSARFEVRPTLGRAESATSGGAVEDDGSVEPQPATARTTMATEIRWRTGFGGWTGTATGDTRPGPARFSEAGQACLIVIRSMMLATSSALSIVASRRP